MREFGDEFAKRFVAFRKQAFAPLFDAVQGSGFAVRAGTVFGERGTDRGERVLVETTHLLGEELVLALARNMRSDRARASHFLAQVVVERYACQLRLAEVGQGFGQMQHIERLASALAAAGQLGRGIH